MSDTLLTKIEKGTLNPLTGTHPNVDLTTQRITAASFGVLGVLIGSKWARYNVSVGREPILKLFG